MLLHRQRLLTDLATSSLNGTGHQVFAFRTCQFGQTRGVQDEELGLRGLKSEGVPLTLLTWLSDDGTYDISETVAVVSNRETSSSMVTLQTPTARWSPGTLIRAW